MRDVRRSTADAKSPSIIEPGDNSTPFAIGPAAYGSQPGAG